MQGLVTRLQRRIKRHPFRMQTKKLLHVQLLPASHSHKHQALVQHGAMPPLGGLLLQQQPRHDIHHLAALVGDGVDVVGVVNVGCGE